MTIGVAIIKENITLSIHIKNNSQIDNGIFVDKIQGIHEQNDNTELTDTTPIINRVKNEEFVTKNDGKNKSIMPSDADLAVSIGSGSWSIFNMG